MLSFNHTAFRRSLRPSCAGLLSLAAIFASLATTTAADIPEIVPGSQKLEMKEPLDVVMVGGIDRFCLKEIAASVEQRAQYWKRDLSSPDAYRKSIAANRERFRVNIGAVDKRVPSQGLERNLTLNAPLNVAETDRFIVTSVKWPVLERMTGEGLLLLPKKPAGSSVVIAIPDADWTPEMYIGLTEGVPAESQLPRHLAEQGVAVLVPFILSRQDTFSGNPEVRLTNQPHREWVYRSAFEMGRHVIGYEVQKILAAVDALQQVPVLPANGTAKVSVAGVGEGGLLALYAAASDERLDAALVSGYFGPREDVWQEPIFRNVWSLLREFGDAETASLIAPRKLIVEAAAAPTWDGPQKPKEGRGGGAAPGRIRTPALADVQKEIARIQPVLEKLQSPIQLVTSGPDGNGPSGSEAARNALLKSLQITSTGAAVAAVPAWKDTRPSFQPAERERKQMQEMIDFTQLLLRKSAFERDKLWSKANRASAETWAATVEPYRDLVYDEMIGRLPAPSMPINPRTRKVLDTPKFTGYEVVLDVYPDVIAGGILLLPKDLQPGEKRPLVVCQHGLEGVPMDTIGRDIDGFKYYKAFAAELCERGFITYAPQNPYRGQDRFRTLQRKSNPLKRSLFSYIIPQHARTLEYLSSLPNVDPKRMAFYGLSYGGKTAVRVPPMVKAYALSICSADFNEWVVKNTTIDHPTSYVFTGEYEIFEWNMGHVANYAELSSLMTPRPFMVERGHTDGVAPDEWVAWEFAKVKRHYDFVGLGDRAELEVFNGPHTINGQGTYRFLHRHLDWPERTLEKTAR